MKLLERPRRIFFAYTMDCERIAAESSLKNGTPSWEISEKAIRGMADVFRARDMVRAGSFYPTPATAARHRELFLELCAEGFDVGCQFHCDTFRSGEFTKYLGEYDYESQKEILALAKQDWEETLGLPMETFRCGFFSANDYTFPILDELGVRQSTNSIPGRHSPRVAACWAGAFPYPHHASRKSRLVCGDLDLYEVPVTTHPYEWMDADRTAAYDLRPDRALPIEVYKDIIDARVEHMMRSDPPVKAIVGITHNTIDYLDTHAPRRRLFEAEVDYVKETVERHGYELVPGSLGDIHREADRIGAF